MEYKDYYSILGVPKGADEKTVKSAYRRLARKHHPDVAEDKAEAERKFKDINEAYEVLSDREKREKYDALGSDWQRYQRAGQPGGFDWSRYQAEPGYTRYSDQDLGEAFGQGVPFSDFFTFIFGDAAGAAEVVRPSRGRDIEHQVSVSLAEAFRGTSRRLRFDSGKTIEVKIPAGVETGSRLRVRGQGLAGRRGASGDLWLEIVVEDDPRFRRNGADLHAAVTVPLYTAVLGGEVTVPLLLGAAKLRVPAETQNGTEMRLRGQGMPRQGSQDRRGDLYVRVEVSLPQRLSERETALFRELAGQRRKASESG